LPETNRETKNSQSLDRLGNSLKELHRFDIALPEREEIKEIIADPGAWAEMFAENAIVEEGMPRYSKAKNLGEKFAREITS
tara:strand:+ start:4 stop:246 length:243 start_codon:yes stop_codon:yes gene_type:complete